MIEINNLTLTPINKNFLKKVTKKVLETEGQKNYYLSIALVGQGRIKKINQEYRGENRTTDVLSFPEKKLKKKFIQPIANPLGEIIICLKEVKKNAKRFGSNFKKELSTCLIHGILHLLGYNHEKSKKEAEKTEKKQKYYLKLLKIY
ncbi:rRNA maturation RNase YbeY [Patescibacteria group bacterium]|nr:rRNA maturation RNase YbeY [Patescibacteria group bacterium]